MNSDILCNLEDTDDGFGGTVRPDRETIQEDWERDGVEDEVPVVEVNPMY